MNVVVLYGGFGNQMFQYAFGESMCTPSNPVVYDTSWFLKERHPKRPLHLKKLNLKIREQCIPFPLIVERSFFPVKKQPRRVYQGYWQSPLYFEMIKDQLQKEFKIDPQFYTDLYFQWREKIWDSSSVSIHIRRGDYLNHSNHLVLDKEYYLKAIRLMKSFLNHPVFFVFSDDLEWCKTELLGDNMHFVSLPESYLEWDLMRQCSHNIIANSTFSWWAAYTNPNPNKIVISPKQWAKKDMDQVLIDQKELLLKEWLKC